MLEGIYDGFLLLMNANTIMFIIVGVIAGLIIGIIPGLGGVIGLVLMLPFVYKMDPATGLIFLLAFHAVTCTGGSITAILLDVPGTLSNAATLIDGFPMSQKGEGDRAIGAALTSSMLGGIFGGVVLAVLIPLIRPIVLLFGSPEIFMMMLFGISFIAVLGRGSQIKGLISGSMGILLAFFGYATIAGVPRYSFGTLSLYDGFELIPIVLGLFALPEVLDLVTTGGTFAKVPPPAVKGKRFSLTAGTIQGIGDVFRHWMLFLRSSVIGTIIGIIPGVGGETAVYVAYGQAKQASKCKDEFGKGCIEGVIAPESANNAKEGGSLMPTLGFGIPGSTGMAILLGAFFIMGLEPGPLFLREHIDIVWSLVYTLIGANILGALICIVFAKQLSKVSFVRGHILAPLILICCLIGAYAPTNSIMDLMWMFVFGVIGYAMRRYNYNRPALVLGFVLGPEVERYLHLSLKAYGPLFFLKPIALILLILFIVVLAYNPIKQAWNRRRMTKGGLGYER